MSRAHYRLFSEGHLGLPRTPNRLVRSATWDPVLLRERRMRDDVLACYRRLAAGGVGTIITDCISCNSCLYEMYTSLDRGAPRLVRCLVKEARSQVSAAQAWLNAWAKDNVRRE